MSVQAEWEHGYYPTGIKVRDEQLAVLRLASHDWHPEWNYDLAPQAAPPKPEHVQGRAS